MKYCEVQKWQLPMTKHEKNEGPGSSWKDTGRCVESDVVAGNLSPLTLFLCLWGPVEDKVGVAKEEVGPGYTGDVVEEEDTVDVAEEVDTAVGVAD